MKVSPEYYDEIFEFNPFLTYSLKIKPVDDNNDKPAMAYESLVGEMNLQELDNVVCAVSSLIEEKENIKSEYNRKSFPF